MSRATRAVVIVLMITAILATTGAPAFGSAQPGQHELRDPHELAEFLNPIVTNHMTKHNIPGAVVVVVKDGEILLKRGYGYANLEHQTPADPDHTLFNIGSVTKLFTATAVMQQVEQGRLDLHTDVNRYLKAFQVPATFPEPITLSHLLTHTAGFDDRVIGWATDSPDKIEPLAQNLARHLPPRIRPPGVRSQYGNHGMALAGHLVEEASGLGFPDYVAASILHPLGMDRTGYVLPPELAREMATGYGFSSAKNQPGHRVYFNVQPAGGLWTTAADMATFMLAHLQEGAYQNRRILAPETVAEMHRPQFAAHPAVSGHAYGFFEHRVGHRRALQHGGEDPEGFSSLLYLLPDEGAGIFLSYNSSGGARAGTELVTAFLDRYFPVPESDLGPALSAQGAVQPFEGSYRWIRQDRHSFTRALLSVMTYRLHLRADAGGALLSSTGLVPFMPETRWIQVEPLVFREEGGTATLAFDQDDKGRISHLHLGWPQPITMQRLAWHEQPALHLGLLLFCVVIFLSAAVGLPVARLYRRLRGQQLQISPMLRITRLITGWVSGLALLFLVGMPVVTALTFLDTYSVSPALKAVLLLPLISTALTIPLVVLVVRLWRSGEGSRAARVQPTLVALAAVAFAPFLYYWRLLGFHF